MDLRDDYDQQIEWTPGNKDEIKNIPFSIINDIGKNSTSWYTCRWLIKSKVGEIYPAAVVNDYLFAYDTFFNHHLFRAYPNPVRNILTIELEGLISGNIEITMYNSAGYMSLKENYQNVPRNAKLQLDVGSRLRTGNYSIILKYPGGQVNGSVTKY